MAVWLGAAFWGSMAMDWIFEPPRPVRGAVLAAAGIGLAVVLFRFILRRAFVRLSNRNMATVLERQFPQLNDSLLTSVSLARSPDRAQRFQSPDARQHQQPGKAAPGRLPLSEVFNPMPLVRKVVIALGLALAIGLLGGDGSRRAQPLGRAESPLGRQTVAAQIRLEAVGFTDGVAKVAAGANFDLRVRAFRGDTEIPVIPDKVEVRYRDEGGGRDRKTMKNIGRPATSAAEDEVLQEYSYPFTGVLSSNHLDIAGGDARLYDLQLKVVPNPNLNLKLVCEYPRYIERGPVTIDSVSGAVPVRVPIGSRVTIRGTADKPLEMVRIDCPAAEQQRSLVSAVSRKGLGPRAEGVHLYVRTFPRSHRQGSSATVGGGEKGAGEKAAEAKPAAKSPQEFTLQFTLRDTDGLKARDPIFLTLVAVPDEPPEVKVRLVGTREPVSRPRAACRRPARSAMTGDWPGSGGTTPSKSEPRRRSRRSQSVILRRRPAKALKVPRSDQATCLWPSCPNIWQSMS